MPMLKPDGHLRCCEILEPPGTGPKGGALRPRRKVLFAVVAAFTIAAACSRSEQQEVLPPAPPPDAPRIVVLPFHNLGDPADSFLAFGVTEGITRRLGALDDLGVISRTSSTRYDRAEMTARQIGDDLGVDFILDGEIQLVRSADTGDRLVLAPTLIRVTDGTQVWSERHDRPMDEIFSVQSEVATRVAESLGLSLDDTERRMLAASPTTNLAAYQEYLWALPLCWSFELEELSVAEDHLEKAVQHDPDFAVAHALLSETHSLIFHFRYDRSPQRLAMARASADHALQVDPNLPEAHRALAYFYYTGHRNFDEALKEFAVAASRRPNDSMILASVGVVHRRKGMWQEAVEELTRAAELDPRSDINIQDLAATYGRLRRYEEAEAYCRQAIELAPGDIYPYVYCARIFRSRDGTPDRARGILEEMPVKDPAQQAYYRFEQAMYERDFEAALRWLEETDDVISEPIDEVVLTRSLAECRSRIVLGAAEKPPLACDYARVYFERARDASPADPALHSALGWVYALTGRGEEAVSAGEQAVELLPITADAMAGQTMLEQLAKIYAWSGEPELAVDTIEESLAHPGWLSVPMLGLDPDWDPIRDDPGFQDLLREPSLPAS